MKSILFVFLLILVFIAGCSSPIQYVYQQPYQGALTGVHLSLAGSEGWIQGNIELDGKTVVFGFFRGSNGKAIQELKLGSMYRLLVVQQGTHYPFYNIEEIGSK